MGYDVRMNDHGTPSPPSREATPEDILNNVVQEIDTMNTSSEELGKSKLKRSAALAVDTIIQIMLYDRDSRTRLKASEILMNRVYGTSAQISPLATQGDMYKDMFEQIIEDNQLAPTTQQNNTENI